jgi:Flp pilus assembly protein TadG
MKRWIDRVLKLARNRDGSAMLEFAIGSGVLIAAFTGTFQFGYSFLQYNNLENAVARGARYASLATYDSPNSTPSAAFKTAVQNMVLYGSTTAGATPVLPGLTASNVHFDSDSVTFTNGVPSAMTVSITGYTINSVFASATLTNKPQVTYPYQGIWAPI